MRPIIIIGFSVFPSFVFLSFWSRDICVTVGIDSSWLLDAGLEGPVRASLRETLLWSIETHSKAQQLQINFLCCGQAQPPETQRSPRAGLKLCLVHGRGKLWDSCSRISLTTEMPVSNSGPGIRVNKHSTWPAGLTCIPWQFSQQLQHHSYPRAFPTNPTLLLVLLGVLLQTLLLESHSGSRRERDRLTDQHSLVSGTVCNSTIYALGVSLIQMWSSSHWLELIYIWLLIVAVWIWLNGIRSG